jgi:hypothetical protein
MNGNTESIRQSYDQVGNEYPSRISGELQHRPFDRELLNRFAAARWNSFVSRGLGRDGTNSGDKARRCSGEVYLS